jgi:hypothetical protein
MRKFLFVLVNVYLVKRNERKIKLNSANQKFLVFTIITEKQVKMVRLRVINTSFFLMNCSVKTISDLVGAHVCENGMFLLCFQNVPADDPLPLIEYGGGNISDSERSLSFSK